MDARWTDYDSESASIRKPRRVSVRQGSRDAALALADFLSSLAESTADFWAAMAEGVAGGLQSTRDTVAPPEEPRARRPQDYAEAFSAAARYFEEMARIAGRAGESIPRPAAQDIDYSRLAKAVAAEILRMQAESTPPAV